MACAIANLSCTGPDPAPAPAETPSVSVEVGIPTGPDGLDFSPLVEGQELRLQTFGQGGTHLLAAVRAVGFGSRAFISASLTNLTTGSVVSEPPPARPQLLYCSEGGACDLVPYLVHASGLTSSNDERHGLRVLLSARAENDAGQHAENAREIVLSTADL